MRVRHIPLILSLTVAMPATAFGTEEGPAPRGPSVERAMPDTLPDEASQGVIQTPSEQESVIPSYGDTSVTGETQPFGQDDPVQGQQPRFDRDVLPAPDMRELPPPEAETDEEVGDIADLAPADERPATDTTEADVLPVPEEGNWRSSGKATEQTRPLAPGEETQPDLVPQPQREGEQGSEVEPDVVPDRPGLVPDEEQVMPGRPGIPANPDAPPGQRSPEGGMPGEIEETESVVPQPGEPDDRRYEVFSIPAPEGERIWEDSDDKIEGGFGPM